MKTNVLFLIIATAILMIGCGTSKTTTSTVNDDALSVLKPKGTSTATSNNVEDGMENADDTMEKAGDGMENADDVMKKAGDTMEKTDDAMEKAGDTIEKADNTMKKAGDGMEKADDATEKAGDVMEKAEKVDDVLEKANDLIEKTGDSMENSGDAMEQVEKADGVMKQADELIEQAGDVMKKADDGMENTGDAAAEKAGDTIEKTGDAIEKTAEAIGKAGDSMEKAKKEATELSTLEAETIEIDEDKIVEEGGNEMQKNVPQNEINLVGKYKWVKRICCGRNRVETTPQDGEELFMECTEDGQILYSGNSQKKADNTVYKMKVNELSFPDRQMLKIEGKVDALVRFAGDTLVIDRGYIDLDKNYWIKVKE